ncbi:MAG: UDP-N-acetylglucosamine diphosphorylase [Verrucomicrobiota bacterium]|nr:UDP-N-acetylglucosamine diphosphorylase [Verrucomicrobiota bacterium]
MIASDLWQFPETLVAFRAHFADNAAPWEWVRRIAVALKALDWSNYPLRTDLPPGVHVKGQVYLHPTVKLPPYAVIEGPCWIGPECDIRPSAYIRGNVIAARGCTLGNSCEYKNALLLDGVETAHFNYVGDTVLGNKAHLGAGVICANLKLARDEVLVTTAADSRVETGLRKLGALVGDAAEVGCNSVLQPGTILGPRSAVISMPFHGYLAPDTLVRVKQQFGFMKRPR